MGRCKNCVVIPALNEEETIYSVVRSMQPFADVIVVNDDSSDGTIDQIRKAGAILINNDMSLGYVASLNSGCRYAVAQGYTNIITADADGEHPPEFIPLLIEKLKHFPIVVAEREQKNRISEVLFGLYTNFKFGIKDPLSGLKGYDQKFLVNHGYIGDVVLIGTGPIIQALNNNIPIGKLEIHVNKRHDKARFGSTISANFRILKAMYKFFRLVG